MPPQIVCATGLARTIVTLVALGAANPNYAAIGHKLLSAGNNASGHAA